MKLLTIAQSSVIVLANFLRKVLVQRHLLWNFVVRDLKRRYVGSFMGFFWSLIHPLVLLVSYTFVFVVIFKIKLSMDRTNNFALFLFCGILPWLYFQDTVVRSCNSVLDHSNLIRKTIFPSELLPLTVALSNLVTHLIGFAIVLVVLLYSDVLGWSVLAIPVYFILLALLSLGLGWLVAALQVFLRDTAQILSVVMVFWFWFTPIFYEIEMVPAAFRFWIRLNPLGHVVQGYRRLLLEDRWPETTSLLFLSACALSIFILGGLVFRNTKREFIDVL